MISRMAGGHGKILIERWKILLQVNVVDFDNFLSEHILFSPARLNELTD